MEVEWLNCMLFGKNVVVVDFEGFVLVLFELLLENGGNVVEWVKVKVVGEVVLCVGWVVVFMVVGG